MKFVPQLNYEVHQIRVACEICCELHHLHTRCRDSVVGKVYAAEWVIPDWNPDKFRTFFASLKPSGPALGPTQTSSQWMGSSLGLRRSGPKDDHSHLVSKLQ
jgi:hypothetical protein